MVFNNIFELLYLHCLLACRADLVEALKMHQISYSEAESDSFEELKSSGVQ